ncbi:hypothetical protein [Amycolatopsis mongoliensis]|uniref:hypothetical protein n=1 Tax=Amycolatopsis mongoliensis TaxID=715475 RepID=UPI0038CC197D
MAGQRVFADREDGGRRLAAAPVGAPEAAAGLLHEADDVVCVTEPPDFRAVGQWYADFRQTSDEDVLDTLLHLGERRD